MVPELVAVADSPVAVAVAEPLLEEPLEEAVLLLTALLLELPQGIWVPTTLLQASTPLTLSTTLSGAQSQS